MRYVRAVPKRRAILRSIAGVATLCTLGFAVGCGPRTIEVEPIAQSEDPLTIDTMDWSDWALTLSRICRGDHVDYGVLLEDRRPLDRALARMAAAAGGSDYASLPGDYDAIAFNINCYNAMMVRSLLELAEDGAMPAAIPSDIESRFRFRLGDIFVVPADLAKNLKVVDWRVRFALCDGRLEGPPLPPRPFLGDLLDAQLNDAVRRAFRSDQVVRIEYGEFKELRLWQGLYDLREELVLNYEHRYQTTDATMLNVLLDWSDRERREVLNSAVGYAVTCMPSSGRPNALDVAAPKPGIFSELRNFRLIRPN